MRGRGPAMMMLGLTILFSQMAFLLTDYNDEKARPTAAANTVVTENTQTEKCEWNPIALSGAVKCGSTAKPEVKSVRLLSSGGLHENRIVRKGAASGPVFLSARN